MNPIYTEQQPILLISPTEIPGTVEENIQAAYVWGRNITISVLAVFLVISLINFAFNRSSGD